MRVPSPRMTALLRKAGSQDYNVACAAQQQLAEALTTPLRQGVLSGDIVTDIFTPEPFPTGVQIEFPLDFLSPGDERDFVAYTVPALGRIAERHVEGESVLVPTYEIASSIDYARKYARDARWDIQRRALEVLEASFLRKLNSDGWRLLLAAGVGRNLMIYDDEAKANLFTKRLVSLMKIWMRRHAGGNSTSTNRGKLTRLYMSPESIEDTRSWTLAEADDFTRREIFVNEDFGILRIFGVELRDLDELGINQEFQEYYLNRLSGTFPTDKAELVVGLDLSKDDCFYMPVREEVTMFEDPTFHRQRRIGFYGYGEVGFSCLDARRVLLGAI